MKEKFRKKMSIFMVALMMFSTSAFSQANCENQGSVESFGIRITSWHCTDGDYVTGSIYVGGHWVVIFDTQL